MAYLISKVAVKKFLSRQLEDYRWLKQVSKKDLKEAIAECTSYKSSSPYKHTTPQLVGWYIGLCLDGFLYYYDMGRGKTRMALDIIASRKHNGDLGDKKALILVDTNANVENWELQVPEHSRMTVLPLLEGTIPEREARLMSSTADTVVLTYAALVHMVGKKVPSKKKDRNQFKIDSKKVEKFASMFGIMVCDEIHKCKNKDSLYFKACKAIGKSIPYRYGLTGTPMHDPIDFWAQFFLVDRGETFGEGVTVFRQAFYTPRNNGFGIEWVFCKKQRPSLTRLMQNRSLEYLDEEDQDLPMKVEQVLPVSMGQQARHYYDLVKRGIVDASLDKDKEKIKNAYMKLRQLASGFLYHEGQILHFEKMKLEALQSIIENSGNSKIVVFYDFTASGKALEDFLEGKSIPYSHIGKKSKAESSAYKEFISDPEKKVAVASLHVASGSLNLQVANIVVFYELPRGLITYLQAMRRCRRPGQQARRVYFYYLLTRGTAEEHALPEFQAGKDFFDEVLRGNIPLGDL